MPSGSGELIGFCVKRAQFYCCLFMSCVWLVCVPAQAQEGFKVGTIERTPFAFKVNQEWTGFSIDLVREIAKKQRRTIEFVEYSNFPEMLKAVENGEVSLAAANISVTAERERVMDFSRPIFDSGLTILARPSGNPSVLAAFFKPQILAWLLGAILLFVSAGFLMSIVERRHLHMQDLNKRRQVGEGIWWAVSVVTNASFTIFTPMTLAGRTIAYALILVGLFVVSAFVAQITAALTVQELNAQIGNVSDLRNKTVGSTEGSTASRYLTQQGVGHLTFPSTDEMFAVLEAGQLDALVHDAPILAYFANTEGRGRYSIVGRIFKPEKYGVALPQGSDLTEALNRDILSLRENGDYERLLAKWFGAGYQ